MFTIKTFLKESPIHGIGVFSSEYVPKGNTVWEFNPRFDLLFSNAEVEKLPFATQEMIRFYGYFDRQQFCGFWVLHVGNDRHTNHSLDPNTETIKLSDGQYIMVAKKDIDVDEEITCDYTEYEDRFKND